MKRLCFISLLLLQSCSRSPLESEGLSIVRAPTESQTLYVMEMSYKSNGKVIDGPLVEGNDLKIKYVDLDDDGRLDVLFQNRFVEGEYAKIIFRPGAPDDDVFKILDYNGCSISWAPFGNVFP